ncbi:MAG: hypothetical protein AUF79_01485 [Crenarchaeota archaeon 13_1_20CM_2_51_8]|nr:MAG: hypothetical protein AUF79_01485 [Crenarchaeota archaeon 13_1_20CM_2_51_8]
MAKTRVSWKLLEVLGAVLTLFATLAILSVCPYFLLFAYGPCDLSSSEGQTGFVVATAGAVLVLAGEIGRRKKPSPKPPILEAA